MSVDYSEDSLVEQPTIALFAKLGWETANCYHETFGPAGSLGRETPNEVVLVARLRPALERLNPDLGPAVISLAIDELTRDRSAMSLAHANCEVYGLLKDGVRVVTRDPEGIETHETVRVIDWEDPDNNDFFLASQFWVSGEMYKRRPDLVGFVNGLPLVVVELKGAHVPLEHAYYGNLKDYKGTIPQLFWYNGLVMLSNGSDTRVGSVTAPWEHLNEWKKITSEGEEGVVSLETAVCGTCRPDRLLDIVENFTVFSEAQGGLRKLVAKNHQYLGVNNTVEAVHEIEENQGRLGVFWHTQGSGKSYSMIFFAQKVLRKLPGNWTFVIVTDRRELDDQIYKTFADAGAVIEPQDRVRAGSGEHLKQLLREDHRYVFTLIHKFHSRDGTPYPVLSRRSDIIVITDEAHRSQYDLLAMNMRNALPNAAFIGFTGTPLMAGEERTRQVFGDYVSIYNFRQSVEDGATVPLYYENRIPELELAEGNLNEEMERLLEAAELDEAQEDRLAREFSREYHLITRNDRLEAIAEDLVLHFMGRGYRGKAMVVAVDKATAVRMYDKVQKHWKKQIAYLAAELESCDPMDEPELAEKLAFMQQTDMAVVVSQGQNEIEEMAEKGVDIRPHRERMVREDLATKFKDPEDLFRIVFVCAMWMTGFDVPDCSTIYLDKPMRNHTLMQTIARANRVFGEKLNGLIVDYIGVFRNLQRALAIYGSAAGGGIEEGETPVVPKAELVEALRETIEDTRGYAGEFGVDLDAIHVAEGLQRVAMIMDAHEALIVNDDSKREYLQLANKVQKLFKAILPDPTAGKFEPDYRLIKVIADRIRSETPPPDISDVMAGVEALLDEYIVPTGYVIRPEGKPVHEPGIAPADHRVDLSQIDFDALRRKFEQSRKRIEAEKLRGMLNSKLSVMMRLNKTRVDYYDRLQRLIDEYNRGAKNVDAFFAELVTLAEDLAEEEKRKIKEQLTEEELAVFDLLTKPAVRLTRPERQKVREVARELLVTLKVERLVLDWRKRQQSRAAVRLAIEQILDRLPEAYSAETYATKCDLVYQHVYDSYYGPGASVYERLGRAN
jgi:type I restriction enzyme R subunit